MRWPWAPGLTAGSDGSRRDLGELRLSCSHPEKIADRAEYAKPHQYSAGVRDVIVNGKFAMRGEAVTTERPGRVLYGPAHP